MNRQQRNSVLLFAGLLFFFALKSKAGSRAGLFTKLAPASRNKLLSVYDALIKAGFKDPVLSLSLAQVLHETGAFTSKSTVYDKNNNPTGIVWINKPYQVNAVKGSALPKSEGKYYYAKFSDLGAWAKDYRRILSKGTKPIQAQDPANFVNRLAANRYFLPNTGKALENYRKGVNFYLDLIS